MSNATISELDILARVISPQKADLEPEIAQTFLDLKFDPSETRRIRVLLRKNNSGTISANEQLLLEKYLRIGQFVDLLRAKAKLSLVKAKSKSRNG